MDETEVAKKGSRWKQMGMEGTIFFTGSDGFNVNEIKIFEIKGQIAVLLLPARRPTRDRKRFRSVTKAEFRFLKKPGMPVNPAYCEKRPFNTLRSG
jgi:hypothetical protein